MVAGVPILIVTATSLSFSRRKVLEKHRYEISRSRSANRLWVYSYLFAVQNCMWVCVRDHRQHHEYSDTYADPHNASNGFFFAKWASSFARSIMQSLRREKALTCRTSLPTLWSCSRKGKSHEVLRGHHRSKALTSFLSTGITWCCGRSLHLYFLFSSPSTCSGNRGFGPSSCGTSSG